MLSAHSSLKVSLPLFFNVYYSSRITFLSSSKNSQGFSMLDQWFLINVIENAAGIANSAVILFSLNKFAALTIISLECNGQQKCNLRFNDAFNGVVLDTLETECVFPYTNIGQGS